ncbi:hypothetical protein L207DRAFT_506199 [Hyaloscypha variabilis F]|uniref:STEEP1 domain-containing protein n=1 Tax=Hyaloscypha variabilis (strain UAMH 11265 / GT02V1 / F) TaxID=1149755 RepID=A0A2J6S8U3_HYAVF|nr:hypothetical protein L207DRAFT_506199 [Hyaloscypha variabilis F]
MALPPKIQTYHCLCTSLLLATTHTLSLLPRRQTTNSPSSSSDFILPLPSAPPTPNPSHENVAELPEEGYSMLLGVVQDKKITLVRREDGFEKRLCWRCERCGVVVAYELQTQVQGGEAMEGVEGEKGKEREDGGFKGKVVYLVPGGVQGTDVMMGRGGGRKIGESDVGAKGVAVFE